MPGRPPMQINKRFAEKVISLRGETDYGKEKLHFTLKREGFNVSARQIQRILDVYGLTDPCEKRRGQRKYVRFQWPMSDYMWHCDWTTDAEIMYCAFIDDRSRKIMTAGEFKNATTEYAYFVLLQAILTNEVCPMVVLSDKGPQFYANKRDNTGKRALSEFETSLSDLGIELWTARRNHPQTNGKMERWFKTFKSRKKKHPEETLQDFVKWYNEGRIHHALGYKTPNEIYIENL